MKTQDEYFRRLGNLDMGDLSRIYSFLDTVPNNLHKLHNSPKGKEINTDINLDNGSDLTCMWYGLDRYFYTIKGEYLSHLFDDWDSIQKWVEEKVGKVSNTYPLISCGGDHIFRHADNYRPASVNMGMYNSSDSIMCWWEGSDLAAHARYEIGETLLVNVKKEHSVIINDNLCHRNFRAILMWTTLDTYNDIAGRQ